jgi:hypothetical protein
VWGRSPIVRIIIIIIMNFYHHHHQFSARRVFWRLDMLTDGASDWSEISRDTCSVT